jgi:hypothetical protein
LTSGAPYSPLSRSEKKGVQIPQVLKNLVDKETFIYISLSISFRMVLVVFHNMTQSLFIQKAPVYQVDR